MRAREGTVAAGVVASIAAPLRELGACSLAGIAVGFLVGGLGGRLAMRISGIAAGPTLQGVRTDAGFPVGVVTVENTMGLLFGGALSGAIGGLLYAAVRPWLAGLGPWRGVAFGLLLLGVLGSLVLDPNNFDFGRFGPVWLNVGMFAALLVIFGGLLAPAIGWIERRDGWGAMGTLLYLASLPPLLFAALGVVQIVGALIGGMESTFASGLWLFTLLVFAVALRWYFARTGVRLDRPVDPRSRRAAALSYAVLALPVAAASWLTLTGIVRIFQMAV